MTRLVLRLGLILLLLVVSFPIISYPSEVIALATSEIIRPDGMGYTETWRNALPSDQPPTLHWAGVDEISSDEGATFNLESNIYGIDSFTLSNPSSTGYVIYNVKVTSRVRPTGAGRESLGLYRSGLRINGTNYESGTHDLPNVYAWVTYNDNWATNPDTGANWTWADFASMEVLAINLASWDNGIFITQEYVSIEYYTWTAPVLTTNAATLVLSNNVTLNANMTLTGWEDVSSDNGVDYRGFVWDTTSRSDPGGAAPAGSGYSDNYTPYEASSNYTAGVYSYLLTSLVPDTTYYVRAVAHNDIGWDYGAQVSFTTLTLPNVITNAATYVAYSTARLNGTLSDDGNEAADIRFQYNLTDNFAGPTTNTTWVSGFASSQTTYVDLTSLDFAATYYFRIQARNGAGTANGTSANFTTANGVYPPENLRAYSGESQITLSWSKGEGATDTLVVYSTTAFPTSNTTGIIIYLDSEGTVAHTGLDAGVTGYYTTWGRSGSVYSINSTSVMATTMAVAGGALAPGALSTPSTWFQIPEYTRFVFLPFYPYVNDLADSISVPYITIWFSLAIIVCIVAAVVTFGLTRQGLPAMIAFSGAISMLSLARLLPMIMLGFVLIVVLGAMTIPSKWRSV